MPSITSANLANAIIKMVAVEAMEALQANLVMANLVNRTYEDQLGTAGDTVNVPLPPTLVANNLAEGGSVVTQNPNLGNAQIVLNTHAESTFVIPDVTRAIAVPDLIKTYMGPAIIAVSERIEGDLLGLYPGLTGTPIVGVPGTPLTEAVLDSAETALFKTKVPSSLPRFLVLGADAYGTVRSLPRFSEVQTIGSDAAYAALASGAVGKVKDFTVFRSQLVKSTGAAPATIHNIGFTRNAFGLVTRRLDAPLAGTGAIVEFINNAGYGLRIVMSFNPNTLSQQFTVHCLYGCAVLRNNHGIQIEC